MTKRMLIDATHAEETRVAVVDGNRLIEFDYESKVRKQLKGSIFLAKVTRVEPSLQAAFVNFGGNRHGFLPFSEIHPDYYRIPIADREALIAEQQAEMEARRRAEEEEDRAAEHGGATSSGDESHDHDHDHDEGGEIEEIGGAGFESGRAQPAEEPEPASESNDIQPEQAAAFHGHQHEETSPEDADSHEEHDFNEGADADNTADGMAPEEGDDAQPAAEGGNEGERSNGRNRGRGRDRGRGRGRGRERGGRSMAANAQRVELVGGDGIESDHHARPLSRRHYKIQEVVKRGQIMLIQVSKEERGNKGAAVTSYLSLPGRYCVLMPNSPRGGGVSRKIADFSERRRMRELLAELQVPEGMSVIMRTAGISRTKPEIKRDLDYLMRLWDEIRDNTLKSTAPAAIHEEGNLVRRSIRDIYTSEIEDVLVSGDDGYKFARDFMKMMIPSHAKRVKQYKDDQVPLFNRYQIEAQIKEMGEPAVTLRSGGYLVINPTEALVSIDVNSGRATKERHIEETALKTNLEAAEEVARQLRLRDLGGLVVIDFIDMEDRRNNRRVEERLKQALSTDRARIQIGRISSFGLLELSRQRLNPSLTEAQFEKCPHCRGMGNIRTVDSAAIFALRAIEEEGARNRAAEVILNVRSDVAFYIFNNKREMLNDLERRYGFRILVQADETVDTGSYRIETVKGEGPLPKPVRENNVDYDTADDSAEDDDTDADDAENAEENNDTQPQADGHRQPVRGEDGLERRPRRGRRGGRRRGGRDFQSRPREFAPGEAQPFVPVDSDGPQPFMNADMPQPDIGEGGERPEGDRPTRTRSRGGRGRYRRGPGDRPPRGEDQEQAAMDGVGNAPPASQPQWNEAPPAPVYEASPQPPAPVYREAAQASNDAPAAPRDYERINEVPVSKKKGWWNRLTE